MALTTYHKFVSPKIGGADTSKLRPEDWNAAHKYTGGANGHVLVRDTSDATYGGAFLETGVIYVDHPAFSVLGAGAIQAAVNAAVALSGSIVQLGPHNYNITAPVTVNMGSANFNIQIRGAGKRATTITQLTAATDIFQVGATGAEVADALYFGDMKLIGGRYALNLNNALVGIFERLQIEGSTVGIYMQGQNESHAFRDIVFVGATQNAMLGGQTNGGPGTVLDKPVVQKCVFEKLRVTGTSGGTGIVITAGVLGAQQSSGYNHFKDLLFESNQRGALELDYAFSTFIDGMSTEEAPSAHNTYDQLLIDNNSTVHASHLALGKPSGGNNSRYFVNVNSGQLFLERRQERMV